MPKAKAVTLTKNEIMITDNLCSATETICEAAAVASPIGRVDDSYERARMAVVLLAKAQAQLDKAYEILEKYCSEYENKSET